jgi:oxygen-independent coproporphyrinogen-3 oxidase
LSIGLQAGQKHLLEKLGRIHNYERFEESYKLARLAGFENINVDLIFGIPGQGFEDWKETLNKVLTLKPEHISAYSLKIEEGTPFGDLYEKNEIDYIDEVLEREMYYYTNEMLGKQAYKHYEISNYGKEGFECKHNMIYWKGEEYFGLGAGAHSYSNGIRYSNCESIEDYIKAIWEGEGLIVDRTNISAEETVNEFMMLGLRLVEGVHNREFHSRFGKDIYDVYGDKINELAKDGLVESDGENVRLSNKGLDFANRVFMEFV